MAGVTVEVNDITLWQYELAPEAQASCAASSGPDLAQRCVYPDAYTGAWNVTFTYGCETLITLPHFFLVNSCLRSALPLHVVTVQAACCGRVQLREG